MRLSSLIDHLVLIAGAVVMTAPVVSLFLATTHASGALPPVGLALTPGDAVATNYTRLFDAEGGFTGGITALGMVWNSLALGAAFAGLKVFLSLCAAYALIYFRIRGATFVFWLLLASLMLPLESRFLPTHTVVAGLGLSNTLAGLVLPLVASGIGTFFFRNFLRTVPDALLESARIDGAGPIRFLIDILAPLSAPMAAALFLVTFVNGWNQYLWPVMITSDEASYTLVRGLQYFGRASLTGKMLACLAVLPPAVLVILFQRQVIKGLFDGNH